MKKLFAVAGMGALLCSAAAFAEPDHPTGLERAFERVIENSIKNPDAPGLENAADRIRDNATRDHGKSGTHSAGRAERPDIPDHVERPAAAPERAVAGPGRSDPPGRSRR